MILEELTEADTVLLHLCLQLEHKVSDLFLTNESSFFTNILVLLGLIEFFHLFFECLERCAIIDKLEILDLIVVSAVDLLHGSHFLVRHNKAQVVQSLSELLRGHLEMFVTVPILEETLGVKSISSKPLSEGAKNLLNNNSLVS